MLAAQTGAGRLHHQGSQPPGITWHAVPSSVQPMTSCGYETHARGGFVQLSAASLSAD